MAWTCGSGGRGTLRRLGLGLGLALGAGEAPAQTTGAIIGVVTDASTGLPVAGARIVAGGAGLPGAQGAVTGEEGAYRLTFLPPGPYRIAASAEGFLPAERDDVLLRVDKTLRVNLVLTPALVRLPEEAVRSLPPAVDVAKAESALVVSREAFDVLPLAFRTFDAAALLAPSARADGGFDGAQARENGVLVEGLSVTSPMDNRLQTAVPASFVEQVDLKTGNYLPEHGRVTGGVLSAVTRSGSNELHGSVFSSVLLRRTGDPSGTLGEAIWARDRGGPDSYEADAGFEVGGPIRKDRLWFHLGFDPGVVRTVTERYLRANALDAAGAVVLDAYGNPVMFDLAGTATRRRTESRTYRFTGKLTWVPVEDHTFTFSTFGSPSRTDGFAGLNMPSYRMPVHVDELAFDLVAHWTGRFAGKRLLAEVAAGWHMDDRTSGQPRWNEGVDLFESPIISWRPKLRLDNFEPVPPACAAGARACLVAKYTTGGGRWDRFRMQRFQSRAALSWLGHALGAHQLKLGADVEATRNDWRERALLFWYQRSRNPAATGFEIVNFLAVPLVAAPSAPADLGWLEWAETRARGVSPALFLQDSWQPVSSLTLNAGLRWEAQEQSNALNGDPRGRIRIRDAFAPRAQAVWDPSGQGRSKVAVAWGRYYETIPLAIGTTNFGSWNAAGARYQGLSCPGFSGPRSTPFDPRSCASFVPNVENDIRGAPATVAIFPGTTPVAPDLQGQYLDQFGATLEYELLPDLTLGFDYQGRRQGRVVEDLSSNDGSTYFIGNPGAGQPFSYLPGGQTEPLTVDPRGAATYDPATGRAISVPFPKPERSYDGLTFRLSKGWSRGWLAQASYTWSRLRGNYPGPAAGPLFNNSPQYDLPTLMTNQAGLLAADRTHLVKVFAARRIDLLPRVSASLGAGYTGSSGAPVNATAVSTNFAYGYSSFLVPRGMAGRTPFVSQLDVRAQVDVALRAASVLRFRMDVLNALDARTPTSVDDHYTTPFDVALPVVDVRCQPGNALASPNPGAALARACPDLAFLKTVDGRPVTANPNYGQPRTFQDPRAFRFGMELTF